MEGAVREEERKGKDRRKEKTKHEKFYPYNALKVNIDRIYCENSELVKNKLHINYYLELPLITKSCMLLK